MMNDKLYPMMIMAASAVTLFSIVGIATMSDKIPSAFSQKSETQLESAKPKESLVGGQSAASRQSRTARTGIAATCDSCGVVEAIRIVEQKGQGSGVGAVAGGVTGGLLGNQIGRGDGRTVATILGAAGGAYVGNEIEKNTNKNTVYRITVRMDDGTHRNISQRNHPGFSVGDKVKVVDGTIVSPS